MSKRLKRFSHTVYECKNHMVFCPKDRFKVLTGNIAQYVHGELYHLCRQKDDLEIIELNVQIDPVHMLISIPPKYAVSSIMGFLKEKLTKGVFSRYRSQLKCYKVRHFWSRGYCALTVGLDEETIRKYVRWQNHQEEKTEKDTDPQMNFLDKDKNEK